MANKSLLCPRCMTGVDADGDGHCASCHNLTDEQAEQMRAFAERMATRRAKETDQEKDAADKLRSGYLNRTGRKEMRP